MPKSATFHLCTKLIIKNMCDASSKIQDLHIFYTFIKFVTRYIVHIKKRKKIIMILIARMAKYTQYLDYKG